MTGPLTLSEFQALRANGQQTDGQPAHEFLATLYTDPVTHRQHVLPGARRALTTHELAALQALGMTEPQIVAHVNARFDQANAPRVTGYRAWRDGPRLNQIRDHEQRLHARRAALAQLEAAILDEQAS